MKFSRESGDIDTLPGLPMPRGRLAELTLIHVCQPPEFRPSSRSFISYLYIRCGQAEPAHSYFPRLRAPVPCNDIHEHKGSLSGMQVSESDPAASKPNQAEFRAIPGPGEWYVLQLFLQVALSERFHSRSANRSACRALPNAAKDAWRRD